MITRAATAPLTCEDQLSEAAVLASLVMTRRTHRPYPTKPAPTPHVGSTGKPAWATWGSVKLGSVRPALQPQRTGMPRPIRPRCVLYRHPTPGVARRPPDRAAL